MSLVVALLFSWLIVSIQSGSLSDVEHIVIWMQENRAYDHYYGVMRGVRGFNDRAAPLLPTGRSPFYQPVDVNDESKYMIPFYLNFSNTSATCMGAPAMAYNSDIHIWDNGKMDAWNTARSPGFGMSYFNRTDLPYYYALADYFLIGDSYYQSTFTATIPNRLHLFSGSNGLSVNSTFDILDDSEPNGVDWITMGEILENAGITWRVYQEQDVCPCCGIDFYLVNQDYVYGYLNMDCPNSACNGVTFACNEDVLLCGEPKRERASWGFIGETTDIAFNDNALQYQCTETTCCPWWYTRSPTPSPGSITTAIPNQSTSIQNTPTQEITKVTGTMTITIVVNDDTLSPDLVGNTLNKYIKNVLEDSIINIETKYNGNITMTVFFVNLNESFNLTNFKNDIQKDLDDNYGVGQVLIVNVYITVHTEDSSNVEGITIYDISAFLVTVLVILIPILLIIFAYRFHRKRPGTDRPSYIAAFKFCSCTGDFYTDFIWSLTLYSDRDNNDLWIPAFIFIFGPHLLSIFVGFSYVIKWRQSRSQLLINEYASRYDKLIIILTMISGFYAATEIITSHLFHLNLLSFQIGDNDKIRITNLQIIHAIIENIPCLIIQYIYFTSTPKSSDMFNITVLAMIFSVTAILFAVLIILSRLINKCIDMLRGRPTEALNEINIEFCFKSSEPNIIKSYHIHTKCLLSDSIHLALNIRKSQIKITQIQNISDGIKIKAKFVFLSANDTKTILNGLDNKQNKLYLNFYKQCTNRLKIQSKDVTLEILDITSNYITFQSGYKQTIVDHQNDNATKTTRDDNIENEEVEQLKASIELNNMAENGGELKEVEDNVCNPVNNISNEAQSLCYQCGENKSVNDGKVDENDGYWYCMQCWQQFEE